MVSWLSERVEELSECNWLQSPTPEMCDQLHSLLFPRVSAQYLATGLARSVQTLYRIVPVGKTLYFDPFVAICAQASVLSPSAPSRLFILYVVDW